MPVRSIEHQGRRFFLGRNRPDPAAPRLHARNFVTPAGWSASPPSFTYVPKAQASLDQMYLNDQEGDCVIAMMAHSEGILTGNATGLPLLFTDAQINALYSAIGGYVPGDPSTDNGCDEVTAMQYWQKSGLLPDGSHKIAGFLNLDGSNLVEVRSAAWAFENAIFGVELPDAWITPFPSASGFVWDAVGPPNPSNGHAFPVVGWVAGRGALISTWGMVGILTHAAIKKYAIPSAGGEVHAVVSQDGLNRAMQREPVGLDWAQILAEFKAMGG